MINMKCLFNKTNIIISWGEAKKNLSIISEYDTKIDSLLPFEIKYTDNGDAKRMNETLYIYLSKLIVLYINLNLVWKFEYQFLNIQQYRF